VHCLLGLLVCTSVCTSECQMAVGRIVFRVQGSLQCRVGGSLMQAPDQPGAGACSAVCCAASSAAWSIMTGSLPHASLLTKLTGSRRCSPCFDIHWCYHCSMLMICQSVTWPQHPFHSEPKGWGPLRLYHVTLCILLCILLCTSVASDSHRSSCRSHYMSQRVGDPFHSEPKGWGPLGLNNQAYRA
jgi:hypothetical protein